MDNVNTTILITVIYKVFDFIGFILIIINKLKHFCMLNVNNRDLSLTEQSAISPDCLQRLIKYAYVNDCQYI